MAVADPATPLIALEAVVLDTETTGLDAAKARLVQIGALRIRGIDVESGALLDEIVDPGVPIPPATSAVHGLSDADVRGKPKLAEIAPRLADFLGDRIVIGHTIAYDLDVLHNEHRRAGLAFREPRSLDVRLLARLATPGLAHYDLDRLCEHLKVINSARHTAFGDAEATARVFAALVPMLREKGIRTLAEVEAASQRLAEQEASRGRGRGVTKSAAPAADAFGTLQRIDSFPYRHRLRDVMSAPALFADGVASVREALHLLVESKVSSLIVRGVDGTVGIVTERDALRAIEAEGPAGLDVPLGRIMKAPLHTLAEDDFVYRAIGRLERLNIRHLPVVDGKGEIVGIVTTRNLLRHRATTAIVLGDGIDSAADAPALAAAWSKLVPMARSLIEEEVDPRMVASVVSAEICALTRRAAELGEAAMLAAGKGPPPVPYAVLVLGSAGRGESLLAADQDNAIVFAAGEPGGPEDKWLEELGRHIAATLDAAGVPLCKGGVMAQNAAWRHSAAGWKHTIDGWVMRQRPQDLLNVDIFFDAVPVHGDTGLAAAISDHAFERARGAPDFMKLLTELARDWRAPLTLFGGIRAAENGRVDLKKGGLMPLFTGARVLAIRHDVRARATPGRILEVAAKGVGAKEDMEGAVEAHRSLIGLILHQQLRDAEKGVPLSPRVELARLDQAERAALKQAFGRIEALLDVVAEGRR